MNKLKNGGDDVHKTIFTGPRIELYDEIENQTEPPRKTLGDFMLAALTGLASNSGYSDNNWPDDWDDYVDRLATGSKEIAKAAFELYEKETGNE